MAERTEIIKDICEALFLGDKAKAQQLAQTKYPFTPFRSKNRQYTPLRSMRVFTRDGFIDRYSGQRLVFPGILRLLSTLLPDEFPFQKNWKMTETHVVYWQLFPTIDHVVPIAHGGFDEESNWVTTSMLHNSAKSNWTLGELGWNLHPPGELREWDGLTGFFLNFTQCHRSVLNDPYLKRWHNAAIRTLKTE